MSTSLQEQLVQAGLADEESLKRSRKGGRRHSGNKRGGGKKPGGGNARRSGQQRGGDKGKRAAASTKTEEQAAPAPQRQPTAGEKADRLRQMVRANRIDRAYAGVPYRFTQGARIREIAVTETQQRRIARGELAIVSNGERCELVPAKVARRVRGIDPDAILVLNSGEERGEDAVDDPYADYRVPDDLMW